MTTRKNASLCRSTGPAQRLFPSPATGCRDGTMRMSKMMDAAWPPNRVPEGIYIGLYSKIRKKSKKRVQPSAAEVTKALRNPRSDRLFPSRRTGSAQGRRGRLAPWTLQPVGAPARRAGRRLQRARVPPPALAAVFRRGASALWKCLGDRLASPLTWRSPARTARRNLFA